MQIRRLSKGNISLENPFRKIHGSQRNSWSSCQVINPGTDDPKCHQSQCQSLFVISRYPHSHTGRRHGTHARRIYIFRGPTLCAMSTFVHLLSRRSRRSHRTQGSRATGGSLEPTSHRQRKLKWSLVCVCGAWAAQYETHTETEAEGLT